MAVIIEMKRSEKRETYFLKFMDAVIETMKTQGRHRTAETYISAKRSFQGFLGNGDIRVSEMVPDLIMEYEGYLRRRGLRMNTVSFYMRILRATYNRCAKEGLCSGRNLFGDVYTGIDQTRKRAISQALVMRLKNAELDDTPSMRLARDMFLFCLYTRGMSFVDMAYLRKRDVTDGMLVYRRKKTGQLLMVKWERCMQDIADRYCCTDSPYLLPLIRHEGNERRQYQSALHLINHNLKLISERLGCGHLTTYVARHTWASLAHSKNIPVSVISEGMGHSSENTTRVYLKSLDMAIINNANRKIIEDLQKSV